MQSACCMSGFAAIMWLSGETHIFPSEAREQVETFRQLPAAVNIFRKHFKCVRVALDVSFNFLSAAAVNFADATNV